MFKFNLFHRLGFSLLILGAMIMLYHFTVWAQEDLSRYAELYWRVDAELLPQTPAGQHYRALYYQYGYEIFQLELNHPRQYAEGTDLLISFAPGLEALMDGRGDEVIITASQAQRAEAYVNWVASVGSPALRQAIRAEQARLPRLSSFAGLTMAQAWELVNRHWNEEASSSSDSASLY